MAAIDFKPGPDLAVGDTVDWFGEPHTIRAIVEKHTHLTDAGYHPPKLVATDGDWEMDIRDGLVPCLTGTGVA